MSATCPCCGAQTDSPVIVDLMTNTVTVGEQSVRLRPQAAEILYILAGAYPGLTTHTQLVDGLYGDRDLPGDPNVVVRTVMHGLRRGIAGLGLSITSTLGRGFLLRAGDSPESHSRFLTNGPGA